MPCEGNTDDNCIIKYHTFTGKPEWAVTTPYVNTVVPLADGTVHAIGYGSGVTFDTVSTPIGSQWTWHAEYDGATGKGKLVHSFGTATGSGSTRAWDVGADTNGDLILTGAIYSGATSVYFDTEFTFSYPEDDAENHLFVLKLKTSGTKVKPSCLSTCNNDGSPVVDPNSCYIDGLCYADGETADVLGVSCVLCDVSKSQTEWSYGPTLGVTQCYIDGECKEGNHSGTAAQIPYLRDRGGGDRNVICLYVLKMPLLQPNGVDFRVECQGWLAARLIAANPR